MTVFAKLIFKIPWKFICKKKKWQWIYNIRNKFQKKKTMKSYFGEIAFYLNENSRNIFKEIDTNNEKGT